jgi:arylsulfatase A-like enzyme
MDAVRADHLSCYGYARPTTPRIDELTAGATLYERAVAPASWTIPSHASLFTGKDPFQHGAHRLRPDGRDRFDNVNALHDDHVTLAEAFNGEGYVTSAFIANDGYLDPRWQLDQGFDTYHTELVDADVLNERVYAWLDTLSSDRFFLFVNYMDTHVPYNTKPREGLTERPVSQEAGLHRLLRTKALPIWGGVPEELKQSVIDQYDTAIANLDEQIGILLDRLKQKGMYDNATVIVTSDHGEAFGEHALVGHGLDVYQVDLLVPLIVKAPGQRAGRRDQSLISLSDLPHLIFDLIPGYPAGKYRDHFPNASGNHPIVAENYFSTPENTQRPVYGDRLRRVRTAVYDWPYKYIDATDGLSELYDLENDPQEENNLIKSAPEVSKRLAERLRKYQDSRGRAAGVAEVDPLTEEQIRKLKALGYIGN